jgi:hypothetical protein
MLEMQKRYDTEQKIIDAQKEISIEYLRNQPKMRDKVAFMKAKQLVNTMVNGSTITSDQIIRTDESDKRTEITSTEIVKEHAMGFIQGLELLFGKEITQNKTTYIYYSKY